MERTRLCQADIVKIVLYKNGCREDFTPHDLCFQIMWPNAERGDYSISYQTIFDGDNPIFTLESSAHDVISSFDSETKPCMANEYYDVHLKGLCFHSDNLPLPLIQEEESTLCAHLLFDKQKIMQEYHIEFVELGTGILYEMMAVLKK